MSNKKYFIRFNKKAGRLEQQITLTGLKPVGFGWKEVDVDECCEVLPVPKTYTVTYASTLGVGMLAVSPYGSVVSNDHCVSLFKTETAHILQDTEYYVATGRDGVVPTTLQAQFKLKGVLQATVTGIVVTGGNFLVPAVEFDEIHFVAA